MADIFETNPHVLPGQNLDHFLADFDARFAEYSTQLRQARESAGQGPGRFRSRSGRVEDIGPVVGSGTLAAAAKPYDFEVHEGFESHGSSPTTS